MDDVTRYEPEAAEAVSTEGPAPDPTPRMPCIGLMGEFSAGKTTLINFLLGEDLLPTRVTATQLPPVWMSYGERAAHYVDTDGEEHALEFDDLYSVPVEGVRFIKIFCEADILREVDLIDTPGISDPNIPDHYRAAVVDYVDAVIWCTHATQAWRESERSVWMTIPEKLQSNSILLATRSDKLGDRDRLRVKSRLQREIGKNFREIIMFSATDAVRACQTENESGLLEASGGAALVEMLRTISDELAGRPAGHRLTTLTPDENVVLVRPTRVSVVGSGRGERAHPRNTANEETEDAVGTEADEMQMRADQGYEDALSAALSDEDETHGTADHDPELTAGDDQPAPVKRIAADITIDDWSGSETEAEAEAEASEEVVDETEAEVLIEPVAEDEELASDKDLATEAETETEEELATEVDAAAETNDVSDDVIADDTGAQAKDDREGVLDLKNYEVGRNRQPEPQPEEGAKAEASDGSGNANDDSPEENATAEADDTAMAGLATGHSPRAIWQDILDEGPVDTVPELVAAFTRFIDTLEDRGLVVAAPAPAVDMDDEPGDTSGWRLLG